MSKTLEQKRMKKNIDAMFQGLDDEYLKTLLEVAYCGEDPAILDEYEKQQKADLEAIERHMKLSANEVVMTEEEKEKINSIDNVTKDGNN